MGRLGMLMLGTALLILLVAWASELVFSPVPAPVFVVLGGAAGIVMGLSLGTTNHPVPGAGEQKRPVIDPVEKSRTALEAVNHPLETVEGIGQGYGTRIRDLGIPDTVALLEFGAVEERRVDLANQLKVEPLVVQRWTSMADLLRIPDLDAQSAEVLEAAGVRTVATLSESSPAVLVGRLFEVNEQLRLTPGDLPSVEQMERWIGLAGVLPQVVEDL